MPEEIHSGQFSLRLPVYVINLANDRSRWEAVAHSAETHAPNFEIHRVEAIDGRAPEAAAREGADVAAFERLCGRLMLPGEYGCYRSHLRALEAFVAHGAPYGLILEDDIVFDEDSAARIEAIMAALSDFGVLKLVNHRRSFLIRLADTECGDSIGRAIHGPQGSAAAYLVSRDGARRLLDALATMTLPWDVALERFWDHGVPVFTTETDILSFSSHRNLSNIANDGYDGAKHPWYGRLRSAAARTSDYTRRIYNVLKLPAQSASGAPETGKASTLAPAPPLWAQTVAGIAVLLFISAVWYESDLYRYVGLALVLVALVRYFRVDFWSYREKLYIGWFGLACLVWAAYVAIRFLYSYLFYPELGKGTAEGIYMLPLLYPTLGYALLLYVRRPFVLAVVFMAISTIALVFGLQHNPSPYIRATALLHNNPIHASGAAGFIALCTIPFTLHLLRRKDLKPGVRALLLILTGITFLVAVLATYELWSKGVWLAMAVALPFLAVTILATDESGHGGKIAITAIAAALVAAAFDYETLDRITASTVETSTTLLHDVFAGDGLVATLDRLIAEESTPQSDRERMMLWVSALQIWAANPLFGAGISWLHDWQSRPYQEVPYNMLHNGYLEVAVRYGIVGLAFYAMLFGWAIRCVWRAARARLIDITAFQCYVATMAYFAVTLLTNSNNRLALGESYMWFAVSFGFYCYFLLQRQGKVVPTSPV